MEQNNQNYSNQSFNEQPIKRGEGDGLAMASFILGICGLVFGWLFGILAIVFSSMAKKKGTTQDDKVKAGNIMGIISVAFWGTVSVLYIIFFVFLASTVVSTADAYSSSSGSSSYISSLPSDDSEEQSDDIQEFYIGETATVDGLAITCTDINVYNPSKDDYIGDLKEGYEIIKVGFNVENTSKEQQISSSYNFSCYADAIQVESMYVYDDSVNTTLDTTLMPGTKTSGYMYYAIPKSTEYMEVYYTDYDDNIVDFIMQ